MSIIVTTVNPRTGEEGRFEFDGDDARAAEREARTRGLWVLEMTPGRADSRQTRESQQRPPSAVSDVTLNSILNLTTPGKRLQAVLIFAGLLFAVLVAIGRCGR